MKRVVVSFVLLAALPGADAASAQAPGGPRPITRSTFIATMDGEYGKLDTNRDKIVTRNEIDAQQRRIAEAKVAGEARVIFKRLDTDGNGQISPQEFVAANLARLKQPDGSQVMQRLDTNRDQKVSVVEYRILTLANFDRLDADRDGVLTVAEQRAGGFAK